MIQHAYSEWKIYFLVQRIVTHVDACFLRLLGLRGGDDNFHHTKQTVFKPFLEDLFLIYNVCGNEPKRLTTKKFK